MGYLGNMKKLYFITLFQALIPAYVIERLFWQARGVGVRGVVYCEIIYGLTVILLEIPSGILADRFGRKPLLVVHGALCVAEFLILLFAGRFWMFGLAVFLAGVGKALFSGSQNALLYDSLLAEGRQGDFEKLLGRLSAIDFAGSMAAALSGGVLANYLGFEFNYILSIGSTAAVFLLSLTLKEPPMITKPESELPGAMQYIKQALALFKAKPLVLIYSLSGMALGACLNYLDEFWQLVLEGAGIPVLFFGAVSALVSLCRIPGSLLAHKLKARFDYRTVLIAVMAVNAAGYAAVFYTRNALCLLPMALVSLAAGIADPLILGFLHHQTQSHIRATVESFASLGLQFASVLVGLVFGWAGERFSIFAGFVPLSAVCALCLVGFGLASRPRGLVLPQPDAEEGVGGQQEQQREERRQPIQQALLPAEEVEQRVILHQGQGDDIGDEAQDAPAVDGKGVAPELAPAVDEDVHEFQALHGEEGEGRVDQE